MKRTVLIIDDNLKLCRNLCSSFHSRGFNCRYATTGKEGIALLGVHHIQVILLDIRLEEESGLEVLKQIIGMGKNTAVIMMTGFGSIETAVQSIKLGAFDFIQKPVQIDKLARIVENAVKILQLEKENQYYKKQIEKFSSNIVTHNKDMLELCERIKKVAISDLPVLICGESGTGKELIADFIHASSSRANRSIEKINCASFPEQLLDNELFGHEKGAFTGADSIFKGVFERSDEGSLFLDELGDMPLSIQAKILRALQNQEIRRLGGKKTIKINIRFIAATNRDLEGLMIEKKFREDLYYRLNAAPFYIPPLRERKDDILLLAEHFLKDFRDVHSNQPKKLSDAVVNALIDHDWPGNVRELKNSIVYAATVSPRTVIDIEDLPPNFLNSDKNRLHGNIREQIEKNLILKTLRDAYYNKRKAAQILGMSRSTLYAKMQKYGIPIKK